MSQQSAGGATAGIVAFSFGLRAPESEPNPCNVRLAEETIRALKSVDEKVFLVAQWEVAKALKARGVEPDLIVQQHADGTYLDSGAVWQAAQDQFQSKEITNVSLVVQPFLQLHKVRHLVKSPFTETGFKTRSVGFDPSKENTQWWTRGPVRLILYALLQAVHSLLPVSGKDSR